MLEDEGRYMIFEEDEQHHLEVYDVVPEDATGEFKVVAENKFGRATCSAKLEVDGKEFFT